MSMRYRNLRIPRFRHTASACSLAGMFNLSCRRTHCPCSMCLVRLSDRPFRGGSFYCWIWPRRSPRSDVVLQCTHPLGRACPVDVFSSRECGRGRSVSVSRASTRPSRTRPKRSSISQVYTGSREHCASKMCRRAHKRWGGLPWFVRSVSPLSAFAMALGVVPKAMTNR